MSNTSTVHIKTDFNCKVYDYDQELGKTQADTYFNVELRKGEHELTFVFSEEDSISKTINYIVEDVDCDYRLDVKIAETICDKAKEHLDSENHSVAFALYSLAAEKGLAKAQNGLGICYEEGVGIEKGATKASEWYAKAAEQGYANAQYNLAFYYFGRSGMTKDLPRAIKWLAKAADQGDADAQYDLGYCYNIGHGVDKDLIKAVEWYTMAAEQGQIFAQFNLGVCYEHGTGIEKNFTKAVEWYTLAAEQGDADAQCNLGVCYEHGSGVEKDLAKAVEWYNKAAEQGNVKAQSKLGTMYYDGRGVKQDYAEAMNWYREAAKQGDVKAQCELGEMYYEGRAGRQDYAESAIWFHKAAAQGDARAQDILGDMYVSGHGVAQDIVEAEKWWNAANKQGDSFVPFFLGVSSWVGIDEMHAKQIGAEAVKWYCKAANLGSICAQCKLGEMYDNGWGVEKDEAMAAHWYHMAAVRGNANAQRILGIKYEEGLGVEQDNEEAVIWYRKAAAQGDSDAQWCLDSMYRNGKCMILNEDKEIRRFSKMDVPVDNQRKSPKLHYLVFDTETAGLPKNYNAPTHYLTNWPRLVQLSWITTDEDFNVLSENDYIVYPDGFTIPEDAVRLHGITTEIAKEKGKPLKEVVDKFMEDFNAATTIVGHNIDFDKKIIGAELIRLGLNDIMSSKEALCTMKGSVDYCKIPSSHGYKWPKLQELHKKLFGCEFEDAHNSMSDVKATLKCFKEMNKLGWI